MVPGWRAATASVFLPKLPADRAEMLAANGCERDRRFGRVHTVGAHGRLQRSGAYDGSLDGATERRCTDLEKYECPRALELSVRLLVDGRDYRVSL
jgi:hypothetical protein